MCGVAKYKADPQALVKSEPAVRRQPKVRRLAASPNPRSGAHVLLNAQKKRMLSDVDMGKEYGDELGWPVWVICDSTFRLWRTGGHPPPEFRLSPAAAADRGCPPQSLGQGARGAGGGGGCLAKADPEAAAWKAAAIAAAAAAAAATATSSDAAGDRRGSTPDAVRPGGVGACRRHPSARITHQCGVSSVACGRVLVITSPSYQRSYGGCTINSPEVTSEVTAVTFAVDLCT